LFDYSQQCRQPQGEGGSKEWQRRRLVMASDPLAPVEHIDTASDMTMQSSQDRPILVTGAAGDIGAIGRNDSGPPERDRFVDAAAIGAR